MVGREASFLLAVLLLAAAATLASANEKLPARYKEWLEKDIVYIISKDERDAFLKLTRDADRDTFIGQFWEIRNPHAGSPVNSFKEEHYRRIEYADTYFQNEWAAEGWRSDRGKIYIVLGPPASRQLFASGGQIYPTELWFYTTDEPSLPPFFHVMFYQKQGFGDFRLYSPYLDGPDKLVRASGAENSRKNVWNFLHDFNPELAHASLTLFPREAANADDPPSLASDAMLLKIINLANDKFHKEKIGLQRRLREEIKTRILPELPTLSAVALALRDPLGEDFIHYSLQLDALPDSALGSFQDRYFLNFEVQTRVMTAQRELIYETTRQVVSYYSEKDANDLHSRPLVVEDRVPAVAGNYELEFLLYNRANQRYYRARSAVQVPLPEVTVLTVGRPVLVRRCEPAASDGEPFVVGGTRCSLAARHEVPPGPRAALSLLVPVYLEKAARAAAGPPLEIRYIIGRLERSEKILVTKDRLDRQRFDRYGTLLAGKSLPLKDLAPGSYLLSLQITDPLTGRSAGATLPFEMRGAELLPPTRVTIAPGLRTDETSGNLEYWRGLCALAHNSPDEAARFFARALERNPQHDRARSQLEKLSEQKKQSNGKAN